MTNLIFGLLFEIFNVDFGCLHRHFRSVGIGVGLLQLLPNQGGAFGRRQLQLR